MRGGKSSVFHSLRQVYTVGLGLLVERRPHLASEPGFGLIGGDHFNHMCFTFGNGFAQFFLECFSLFEELFYVFCAC